MSKITSAYDREVKQFTDAMKYKLHSNRHKGKWENATLCGLFAKLREEVDELESEIMSKSINETAVMLEAADVGNMALMIANLATRMAAGEMVAINVAPTSNMRAAISGARLATQVAASGVEAEKLAAKYPPVPGFLTGMSAGDKISIDEVRKQQAPELDASQEEVKEAIKL